MRRITAIWAAGTGYGAHPDGISLAFADALDPRIEFVPVRYPASYIHPISYADSVEQGRLALIDAICTARNPVVLGGYSQGARIAGDLAAEVGRGLRPNLEVVGCALIADPLRPVGAGMPGRPIASGFGISGQRFVPDMPVWWAAAEGDPITALPAGNPLRSVADLTEFMTLTDPVAAHRWGVDLVGRAVSGRWQRWWSPGNWRSWSGAVGYASGYVTGAHTTAYAAGGAASLAAHLASVVNREVS